MDTAKIEEGVRLILEGVGEDPDREGLRETPARVARMYEEILSGLHEDPGELFVKKFNEGHQEMVLVHDIPIYSICEHHLVPFYGVAHLCMSMRGIKKPGSKTTTSAVRGSFITSAETRAEALSLIRQGR